MSDKVLARFADRLTPPAEPPTHAGEQEPEEISSGAFGYLRGVRDRALMLELRFKDGSAVAFNYAMLDRATFDPVEGIKLRFPGQEVHIRGQRLNETRGGAGLFDAILRHRAVWIKEAERADLLDTRLTGPLVEAIRLP